MTPGIRVRLQGYYGDTIKKNLTITSLTEEPLEITDIIPNTNIDDKIKYKLKTEEKGKKYSLEISTGSGINKSFRGKITLKTNFQKKPEIDIYVTGKLQKTVKVSPRYLYFGVIDTSKEVTDPKSLKRTVMVFSNIREDDVNINKIEPSKNWIATAIDTDNKSKKKSVIITLDKDKLTKGDFKETVTIHAYAKDDKRPESLKVIIAGKVK